MASPNEEENSADKDNVVHIYYKVWMYNCR